ncbi:MAG: AtpZ/AtpI family protein [Oscillospiraceae bacterium]|nr:AtpZ/AtpI family protein [Oscillospiraceae bacterium]
MDNNNRNGGSSREFARALAALSQIGITIAACIGVGIFIGWFLDNLLGTSPWLLLVFTLLGTAAAFKSIFDFAKKM